MFSQIYSILLEVVAACHSAPVYFVFLKGQLSESTNPTPHLPRVGRRLRLSIMGSKSVVSPTLELQTGLLLL